MSVELQELKPSHRQVMALLAQGKTLREICETFNLNYQSWVQLTNTSLFKAELSRLTDEIQERMIDDFVQSPALAKLTKLQDKAIDVHSANMENTEEPSVAQRAAESVLDRIGITRKQAASGNVNVQINISPGKLELLKTIQESPLDGKSNPTI